MDDDKIKYSDIIEPDDSLEKLIKQLGEVSNAYTSALTDIKAVAKDLAEALKKVSGATKDGQNEISQATVLANKLKKAQEELCNALTSTGQQIAYVKSVTSEVNRASATYGKEINSSLGSLDQLTSALKRLVNEFKSLSNEQRKSEAGEKLILQILNTKQAIADIDKQIQPYVEKLTALQRAEQRLADAQTDDGQKISNLKNALASLNAQRKLEYEATTAAAESYNQYKAQVALLEAEYKALSKVERDDILIGDEKLQKIQELKAKMAEISESLKYQAERTSALYEAEQKLARVKDAYTYAVQGATDTTIDETRERAQLAEVNRELQIYNDLLKQQTALNNANVGSYEALKAEYELNKIELANMSNAMDTTNTRGQALIARQQGLKKQLEELKNAMMGTAPTTATLGDSYNGLVQTLKELKAKYNTLSQAEREDVNIGGQMAQQIQGLTQKVQELNSQRKEEERIAKLQAQLNNSALGSYNQMAAQYELNKIELKKMSAEEINTTEAGKKLLKETEELYAAMRKFQEATGNYRLSVGNYKKMWDGLGFSVSQVVRELPSLAVSANTFFLAISNNVPMVIDEIKKLRLQNKALAKEGQPTVNITKQIIKSLVSWQTALVVLLAVFSTQGKQILDFIGYMTGFKDTVASAADVTRDMADAIKSGAGDYGQHLTTIQNLTYQWNKLGDTLKEKQQFIKDYASAFKDLDIGITNVTEAEAFFNDPEKIKRFVEAQKIRTKSLALSTRAAENYNKALAGEESFEADLKDAPWYAKTLGTMMSWFGANKQAATTTATLFFNRGVIGSMKKAQDLANKEAEEAGDLMTEYDKIMDELGIKAWHKQTKDKHPRTRQPRDLTDTIQQNELTIRKKYEESITNLMHEEWSKRKKELVDSTNAENASLEEKKRKNETYVANVDKKYKELTTEQKEQVAAQNALIDKTIENNKRILEYNLIQVASEQKIQREKILRNLYAGDAKAIEQSVELEKSYALGRIDAEKQAALATNATLEEGQRDATEIIAEYEKKREDIIAEYDQIILNLRAQSIANQLELVKKGTKDELSLLLKQNEVARQAALAQNRARPVSEQQNENEINQIYDKKGLSITGSFDLTSLEQAQALAKAEFNIVKHSSQEITEFELKAEIEMWEKKIALAKSGALQWSQEQIATAEATVKKLQQDLKDLNFVSLIGQKGLGGSLLSAMGFDDKFLDAFNQVINQTLDSLQDILDAEVELAEAEVDLAEERVDAAQSAYEAEVEARANGYANNVATTKKELQLEKKKQAEKEKILAEAQRNQESINTLTQTSSLITASANLWSSLSGVPLIGHALAVAAIASMWASFAAAKVKARQVTAKSQEYGEGGLEFLDGGSHASGNDIDLGVQNSKKRRMRAEGGEALAIINKKQTAKYRQVLPDVIESLNKGTFEDKFLNAFASSDGLNILLNSNNNISLTKLETDLAYIRKQNETKYYTTANGITIMQRKNVKRIIR